MATDLRMAIEVTEEACSPSLLEAPLGPDRADELARGFQALADPVRLRILSILAAAATGAACVCDLVGPLGRSQPTVSHHLKTLADAGLVHGTRRGKWVWYSLDRRRVAELQSALEI